MDLERCKAVVEHVRGLVAKYKGTGITEQDTKNALIEPVLAAFGWPKDDLERVRAEYRRVPQSNPSDYALLSGNKPVVLVEAKALDVQVDEHRHVAQVVGYANMAAAEWALVTNGDRWDLYAVLAPGEMKDKRVFSKRVVDGDFLDWMAWISPARLEARDLTRFWRLLVAERQVKTTMESMFRSRSDALVALLAVQTGLAISEVATALQALRMTVEGPSMEGRMQILAGMGPVVTAPPPAVRPPQPPSESLPVLPVLMPAPSKSATASVPLQPSTSALPAPTPGNKPEKFTVGGMTWTVKTWRELVVRAAEAVHTLRPEVYDGIFDAESLRGRSRALFSRSADGMVEAMPIPGGFAEGNQSAASAVALANKLLAWAKVSEPATYTCTG
jgi:hypothetical protein